MPETQRSRARQEARPRSVDAPESTPYVTANGALTVTWTIEVRAHLLAAGRILELDPARRHQARHIFGLAARVAA